MEATQARLFDASSPGPPAPPAHEGVVDPASARNRRFRVPVAAQHCHRLSIALLRAMPAVITMSTSIFVMKERDQRGVRDATWLSFWCGSMTSSLFMGGFWTLNSKQPYTFLFLAITIGFLVMAKLSEGSKPLFEGMFPVLPLGTISGSIMACLYLKSRATSRSIRAGLEEVMELQDVVGEA